MWLLSAKCPAAESVFRSPPSSDTPPAPHCEMSQPTTPWFDPPEMVGVLLARKDSHENNPGLRRLGAQPAADRANALGDFGGRVLPGVLGIARIVRADVKHDDPRTQVVQLTVIQAPQHILNSV